MDSTQLQAWCDAWTGVACTVKAEDELVLTVAGHAFAALCLFGPERGRLSFRVDAERFVGLGAQAGIVPAHYAARPFWVTLVEPERYTVEQTQAFVQRSYELVRAGLSRRQQAALEQREAAAPKKRSARKRTADSGKS